MTMRLAIEILCDALLILYSCYLCLVSLKRQVLLSQDGNRRIKHFLSTFESAILVFSLHLEISISPINRVTWWIEELFLYSFKICKCVNMSNASICSTRRLIKILIFSYGANLCQHNPAASKTLRHRTQLENTHSSKSATVIVCMLHNLSPYLTNTQSGDISCRQCGSRLVHQQHS